MRNGKFRKTMAILLAAAMAFGGLTACGNSSGGKKPSGGSQAADSTGGAADDSNGGAQDSTGGASAETRHHKIGVGLYTDSGKGVEAVKAYCEGISDAVNCEFVFTTLSTYDEATNLSEIQNLISSGCEGIIMTADMGTTSIVQECQSAGVYLAGFLCDYNQSMNTAFDETFGNEYFLGTVCDGMADVTPYCEAVADEIIAKGYKNIGVVIFPSYAYPNQTAGAEAFKAKIDAYNATADAADQITVADPVELNFAPLEDTYFSEHPDMDCLFSLAAGAGMVYPVMVANGKTDIKLYTTGFEGTDDTDNFGSAGNQCYQGTMFSTPEAIVYPLCLLIDRLNGTVYSDLPKTTERVECSPMMLLSDEDMKAVVDKSIYYTADYSKAFLSGEEVVQLCASYNPDATYAKLVETISHMGVDDLK